MENKLAQHTFHIPVMGTGFTIDTPIKVAHFGIDSVVSIIDHRIIEQMREYHCNLNEINFIPIRENENDCRAKRITAYLNLLKRIVLSNFERLKKSSFEPESEITEYFDMLPETSSLKAEYNEMLNSSHDSILTKQALLKEKMVCGRIDVNIMTKIDSVNYSKNNEPLPVEYNDAHAALRGFANSNLESSLVLSAGLNPKLFGYMANFADFFPNANGYLKKKIILKVSDYRSAIIQGKILAKKGLWVSEFRIESGLNCGGHAFATEGYLLGPILNEFKDNRNSLIDELFGLYTLALQEVGKYVPVAPPEISITAQGGVGTFTEHTFLMDYYGVNSVGWGSPFLLVPEVVNIDKESMDLIATSDEGGFYLSPISPLGILFNTVRGTSGEIEKQQRATDGKSGAPCTKKYLTFNTEFTERPICSASIQYQKLKIAELDSKDISPKAYKEQLVKITDKVCLCVTLGNGTFLKNHIEIMPGTKGASVCPGPNMAYFSKSVSLKEMINHIYGRTNIIDRIDRPNMFIKELMMYMDYLKERVVENTEQLTKSQVKYYQGFQKNLSEGITYYKNLFSKPISQFNEASTTILKALFVFENKLNGIIIAELEGAAC